ELTRRAAGVEATELARWSDIAFALAPGQLVSTRVSAADGPRAHLVLFDERPAAAPDGPFARSSVSIRVDAGRVVEIGLFAGFAEDPATASMFR
ncbi:hypothetical protein, partial [Pseudonocardia pini]|uniref:hypothetical protein n=1 Tax=Pseudonocardia pini TaxID=2758030 RepID=UPI0015F052A7